MPKPEDIYLNAPTWLQNLAVRAYGRKLFKKRYKGSYGHILATVQASHTWSADQRRQYQSEKLHEIVRHCIKNVPYYRRVFAELGLHHNDITDVSHVTKLPVLNKQTVRQNWGELLSKNGPESYAVQHTSGSTGTPLSLHTDEYTYKLAMALLVDFEERHGVSFGEKRATFAGRMLLKADKSKGPFWRFNPSENQLLFSSYHINEKTFYDYSRALAEFSPAEIIGYPSAIYELAIQYDLNAVKPAFTPKLIVTNSENLFDWQKNKIESVFQCKVKDYYSTAEYLNFSSQNKTEVYQSSPLPGIIEVRPEVQNSLTGPMLMTTLTNYRMPLLRYEIGDIGTLHSEASEKYGAPDLQAIEGRTDDQLETIDGRRISRLGHIFKELPGVKEAQIVQYKAGQALIKIVPDPRSDLDQLKLLSRVKTRLGSNFVISIELVEEIPRGKNGKFRFIIKNFNRETLVP